MDNRSVGVFDSGLGGLTAVKQIMAELPSESVVYFGDTGRVPYGTRSRETIIKYSKNDVNFLLEKDVKMILIACGTASSAALSALKAEYDIPIIGVVEPAVDAALLAARNGKIGVIGTAGTIKSGSYEKLLMEKNPDLCVYTKACPLFVPLVENGHFDTEVTALVVAEYLEEMKAAGVDTLILGCTHYPLLKNAISRYMGEGVTLIDAGAEAAKALSAQLNKHDMHSEGQTPEYKYYVSDNIDGFETLGGLFLEKKIDGQVEKIDIEKF